LRAASDRLPRTLAWFLRRSARSCAPLALGLLLFIWNPAAGPGFSPKQGCRPGLPPAWVAGRWERE